MSQDAVILLVTCVCIAVVIIAYLAGKVVGHNEAMRFRWELLGVGSVWLVGDDGRLHEVREGWPEDMWDEVD